jgi:predicted nucleic acid-binding protein
MRVAVDTSVLVALFVPDDIWRPQAAALVNDLRLNNASIIYFDCVIAEALSTAVRRLHERRQAERIPSVLQRFRHELPIAGITWVLPDSERLYEPILALVEQTNGLLNFYDALIALACREREIPMIASFDPDFDQISWLRRLAAPDNRAD